MKTDEVAELLQEVSENPREVIAQYKFAEQAYTTYSISLSKDGDLEVTLGEVTVCAKKKDLKEPEPFSVSLVPVWKVNLRNSNHEQI